MYRRSFVSSEASNRKEMEKVLMVEWEDYEQEVATLSSLSTALEEAKERKSVLDKKMHSLIQIKAESQSWLNELEQKQKEVDDKKLAVKNLLVCFKLAEENVKKEEARISIEIGSLLVAGTALSVAHRELQESESGSDQRFAGVRSDGHLRNLQKMLRLRQQCMVSQVSLLYPIKISAGPSLEQELQSFSSTSSSGSRMASIPKNQGSMTILGFDLTMFPLSKLNIPTDKEIQRFATALGYVSHFVSLVAAYLDVPLRYQLQLSGSRSYITNCALLVEAVSDEQPSVLKTKSMGFPLFIQGHDTARTAYAVFLLNKDLEQLLNCTGAQSLGPCHVLANLMELTRRILSAEFLEM